MRYTRLIQNPNLISYSHFTLTLKENHRRIQVGMTNLNVVGLPVSIFKLKNKN